MKISGEGFGFSRWELGTTLGQFGANTWRRRDKGVLASLENLPRPHGDSAPSALRRLQPAESTLQAGTALADELREWFDLARPPAPDLFSLPPSSPPRLALDATPSLGVPPAASFSPKRLAFAGAYAATGHVDAPLARRMARLFPTPRPAPGSMERIEFSLLAQALANVAGRRDPARADSALQDLMGLDPAGEWRDALEQAGPPGSTGPHGDAWRLVQQLATVPAGMALLQRCVRVKLAPQQADDLAILCKAADRLADAVGAPPTPRELLARCDGQPGIPALAVRCAAARLAYGADAATAEPAWSLNAIRNDLFETGPGSDFARIEARLAKFGTWIARAARDDEVALRPLWTSKSPMRSLTRFGLQQVERGETKTHRARFQAASHAAACALRDVLQALLDAGAAPADALLHHAVLAHWTATPPGTVQRLDAGALSAIAERMAAAAGAGLPPEERAGMARALATSPALRALHGQALTPALLSAWARVPARRAGGAMAPFHAALQRADDEVASRDTRATRVDTETVRAALKEVVANIQGSSRLRWTNGGMVGIGTKGITGLVSSVLTGFTARARVDARRNMARQAVFEIAMPPYDMEIVLGTQRQSSWQVGGGVAAGMDFGVTKAIAGPDVVLHGADRSDISGISLRLPRVRGQEEGLRRDFSALVDLLIDETVPGRTRTGSLLERLLARFPALTVNLVGKAGERRTRRAVTLEGAAMFDLGGGARVGAAVGGGVETSRPTRHYHDASGSLRVSRTVGGSLVRGAVGGRVFAGASVQVDEFHHGHDTFKAKAGYNAAEVSVSADVFSRGSALRHEFVTDGGRLQPISFKEIEYQTVEAFARSVRPALADWITAKTTRDLARLQPPAGLPPERHDAWRRARHADLRAGVAREFDDFLAGLRRHATPTQTFAERRQISPAVARRIDGLRSLAVLALRTDAENGQARAARAAADVEALLADEASWTPASLRSYERITNQSAPGLQMVVLATPLYSAEASHILSRID